MVEVNAEPTPKQMSRKSFLRVGKAVASGFAAGAIAGTLPHAMDSVQSAEETYRIEEAKKVLFARIGVAGGGVFTITGDHIAHNVQPDAVLMGETRGYQLYTTKTDVDHAPREGEWFANGVEWSFGRDRMQEFYNSMRTPKLVISTDGDAMYSREYIKANASAVSAMRDLIMKLYDVVPMVSYQGVSLMALHDREMARRTFLKALGIGGAGAVALHLFGTRILPNLDVTDVSKFPPFWQKIISNLPFQDSIPLRNKIMPANMNALANVPFYILAHQAHVFTGGGHKEIASEILRKPADVGEDLRRFLIGDRGTAHQGFLYNLFDIYHQETSAANRREILVYTPSVLDSLFAPVIMRVNYTKMRDDLGAFHALQRDHSMYENLAAESAFVIATRSLKEIQTGLIQRADPVLRDDKAYMTAWDFFQRVANWIYSPKIAPPGYLFTNIKEKFVIGQPVAFQKGQERIAVFGYPVSIDRGFVTRIEEPSGKG